MRCTDGNNNITHQTISFTVDTQNPTLSATNASDTWKSSNISITLNGADATSGIKTLKYSWDNADCTAGTDYTD